MHPGGFRSFYLMPTDVFRWRFYQVFPLFGTNSRTNICIWHKGAAAAHDVSSSWSRASAPGLPVFICLFTVFKPQILLLWEDVWPAGVHIGANSERVTSSAKLSILYSCFVLRSVCVSTKCHGGPKRKEIYSDSLSDNSAT